MNSKKQTKNIAIIGLGLIGGSLAKALKLKGYKVTGISKSKATINLAKKQKAINAGYTKLSSKVLADADVVFICTPLNLIPSYIKKLSKLPFRKDVVITDVGSTKAKICKAAFCHLPLTTYHCFIGGHPMAGTEQKGFKCADKNLFNNCAWILTPAGKNKKINTLQKIIKQVGAKPIFANPQIHDEAVALVSHFPLLVSIALCSMVKNVKDKKLRQLAMELASSGFRDTTRIAGGNIELSLSLLNQNSHEIKKLLPRYIKELKNKSKKNIKEVSLWRKRLFDAKGKNTFLK